MARKGKDLFVILAERQKRAHTRGQQLPEDDEAPRRGARSATRDAEPAAGGAAVRAAGGAFGRWVTGAVRSLGGRGDGAAEPAPPRRSRSRNREAPRQVPRGLLVPGWILGGMLTAALGFGFVVGRFTVGDRGTVDLQGRAGDPSGRAGVVPPRGFDREPPELTAAEETAELHKLFYVVQTYHPEERAKAAELARRLRARGIANARYRAFHKNGSLQAWATLCYVASFAEKQRTLDALQRLESELGFEVIPGLKQL